MDFMGNTLLALIGEHVNHHQGLNENMDRLKRKCEELKCRKEDVESKMQIELKPGKKLKKEVEHWLTVVERFNDKKRIIENQVERGRYLERSCIGKHVAQMIEEVDEHHRKGSFSNGLVVDAPPRIGLILPTTKLVGETTAKRKMEEIWSCLISDDVRKIGVYGMGGSGKTTIIKHINNRILKRTDKFDRVIWVSVSKALNLEQLQKDIASALEVDLQYEDETLRAAKLFDILGKNKRYLLILDDMWVPFPLDIVGIPEPTPDNGCKIILTTRSLDICRRMNCQGIKMELLSEVEAWNLFLDTVGRDVLHNPRLESTMKLVAEQCACLPLAIITIAGSMKGVDEECEWRNALEGLKLSTVGLNDMGNVLGQLKYSYDRLKDKRLQHCLLYCALYPENYGINRTDLIFHLIAEGITEGTSWQAEFDMGHSMLNKLENVCLLESVKGESNKPMKMHDLIRDMALQIMGRGCMIEAGVSLRDLPDEEKWREDLQVVSLMHNNMSKIRFGASSRCSRVSTLLLSYNKTLKRIPGSFFMHMHGLRVLDLSCTGIQILPDSISDLENLTALLLRSCTVLRHVPSLAKLKALVILDLSDTRIDKIPHGMKMLINLKCLYLSSYCLKALPSGILARLSRLQCLLLWWESETLKVKEEEVAGLRKLETLTWKFADVHDLNTYVRSLPGPGPNKYLLHVGPGFDETRNPRSRKVILTGCKEGEDPLVLPNNIEYLQITSCDFLSCLFDVSLSSSASCTPLQSLEELRLDSLQNLRVLIWGEGASPPPPGTFSLLQVLSIFNCQNLKKLFTFGSLPNLPNLVEIRVSSCGELENIITVEAEEEQEQEMGETSNHSIAIIPITLPRLNILSLGRLQKLKSIVCNRGIMVCDSLQSISINNCPKLKRLPLSLPMLIGQPCPHPSLKSIDVEDQWWESLEWDHPIAKDVLQPLLPWQRQPNQEMPGHWACSNLAFTP